MRTILFLPLVFSLLFSCNVNYPLSTINRTHTRHLKDTLGFAQYPWQLDSIIARIPATDKLPVTNSYKAAICPHDDYGYAGGLYFKTLSGIKAKTIVLVGVAHRARNFKLQDKLIFGSFDAWDAPQGPIKISPLRNQLLKNINPEIYVVHDRMMQLEHSLEAITPFLQKMNAEIEIIPLLVPYNTFESMNTFSTEIAQGLHRLMKAQSLSYGTDLAIVISNDAIHYGSTGWSSDTLAPFGVDSLGTAQARQKDLDLIDSTLDGDLSTKKIKNFNEVTIMPDDYKAYKWTWCGRYSTPFGLLTANKLNLLTNNQPLHGTVIDWRSSIHNARIEVSDLGMGHTAPASNTHWVAYVGIGYE